ncbi:MAG: GNAT family N-acetyltransferase [Actinomycetales bacterium]|nr:GNAT family N-acetyltransferase [Actinomycetales bacterium]
MDNQTSPDFVQHVLKTERLQLHLVHPDHLIAIWRNEFDNSALLAMGFTNPLNVLIEGHSPVRWRAPQVLANPELNRWFIRWIVLAKTREVVGSISFHAPPNEAGMIEIGLGIEAQHRRQGYAQEALMAMWHWASQQSAVKILRYTVSPENLASVALVEKFGFLKVGQQIDEEDGTEDIYEMSVTEFRNKMFAN